MSEPTPVVVLGAPEAQAPDPAVQIVSINSRRMTHAFLATLIIGAVVETFGGSYGSILAAGAMLVYFAIGHFDRSGSRNTERFADSMYYLGFILTLWALFLAMNPVFVTAKLTSQGIIEKFGVAILTTFVGMTSRILLVQMRPTATDQEEEARDSIAQYTALLNEEIAQTVAEMKRFRDTSLSESGSLTRQLAGELKDSMDRISGQLETTISELRNRIGALDIPMPVFTEKFHTAANSFATALSGTVASMEKVKAEIDAFHTAVAAAQRNVADTAMLSAQSANGAQMFASTAGAASEAIDGLKTRAGDLAELLGNVKDRLDSRALIYTRELDGAAGSIKVSVAEFKSEADAFSSTIVKAATDIKDALGDVRDAQR